MTLRSFSVSRQLLRRLLHRRTPLAAAFAALTLVVGATFAVPAVSAAPSSTTPTGWVRLGHLSPQTPAVDVYLGPFGGSQKVVVRKAGYGALTDYVPLNAGTYSVAMRGAGAAASSPAVLSVNVTIAAGKADTVIVTGGGDAELTTKVFSDDLSKPTGDQGRVRLIQGAPDSGDVDVSAVDGPALARDLTYGEATGYGSLRQGRWSVKLSSQHKGATTESTADLDVRAGTVQSLLVLRTDDGGLELRPVVDGTGIAQTPQGGVETGAGGTASLQVGDLMLAGALALLLVGVGVLATKLPYRRAVR